MVKYGLAVDFSTTPFELATLALAPAGKQQDSVTLHERGDVLAHVVGVAFVWLRAHVKRRDWRVSHLGYRIRVALGTGAASVYIVAGYGQ